MPKKIFIFMVAIALPSSAVMASDISNCISSCQAARIAANYSCMNFMSDANRYSACLSDADRTQDACEGRCYIR